MADTPKPATKAAKAPIKKKPIVDEEEEEEEKPGEKEKQKQPVALASIQATTTTTTAKVSSLMTSNHRLISANLFLFLFL